MSDLTAASLQLGALQLQLSGREHATPVGGSSIANEINAALAAGLHEAYVASTADAAPALTPAALLCSAQFAARGLHNCARSAPSPS